MSIDTVTKATITTTTTEPIRVIPWDVTETKRPPHTTEIASSAVVQGKIINTLSGFTQASKVLEFRGLS